MSVSFDRIAERYDQTRGFPPGVAAKVAAGLAREVGLVPGMRLLEIGVGTGRIAVPLATQVADLRYVGADISPAMMQRLRAKLQPTTSIDLLQADATRLPFKSRSFDVALQVHVLHLVSSVAETIEELWRVLKPGGLFLSGYTDQVEDSEYVELRYHRWQSILEELSGKRTIPADLDSQIDEQILPIFGQAQTVTVAEWHEPITPRAVLDLLASRAWSDSWKVPEPIFSEAVRRINSWARQHFSDLDRPLERQASFKVEIYER